MTDYHQVLGQAHAATAMLGTSGVPELHAAPHHPPCTPVGASKQTESVHCGVTHEAPAMAFSSPARPAVASSGSPHTPASQDTEGGSAACTPPPSHKLPLHAAAMDVRSESDCTPSSGACTVVLGSRLGSARELVPLESRLLKLLQWRLNDPCAFDWATSIILAVHPTAAGCEPGPVARGLLLRASIILDCTVLHPWSVQQCQLSMGVAAAAVAGLDSAQLEAALHATGVPHLCDTDAYHAAHSLVGACAEVCPPLEGHCLVEAAVAEFEASEFLWLQSHCEASRGLVVALQ